MEGNGIQIKLEKRFVEVVRCKDCYWRSDVTGECTNIESICWRNGCTRDDFYCADGERKKGAAE